LTTLDIHSIVFAMPIENPLPPLRLLGDLHDDVDGTGLDGTRRWPATSATDM
jgi:hypothetical protein